MWSPTKLADGGKAAYGFGWQTGEHRGKRTVSHGGGIEGFSTMVLLFPEDRVGVVVLMNSDRTNPGASPRTSPGWLTRRWHGWSRRPSRTRTRRRRRCCATSSPAPPTEPWTAKSSRRSCGWRSRRAEGEADAVKSLGKLQKLEPLEREASGGTARRFKYRAAFEHRTMLIHFHLNDEGKIVLMNLEQE